MWGRVEHYSVNDSSGIWARIIYRANIFIFQIEFSQWRAGLIKKIILRSGCGEYKFSIRMNIRIYLYPKNNTNEYPNIFVSKIWYERISEYIRIKKAIRMNIQIYLYQKNDTNIIRTNIHIGKYLNARIHSYQIFVVLDLMLEVGFSMCDTTEG